MKIELSITSPTTSGPFCVRMPTTSACPRPGRLKIASVMTAPPIR